MSTTYLVDKDVDVGEEDLLGMVELEELDRVVFLPGRLVMAQILGRAKWSQLEFVMNNRERTLRPTIV